jgi:cytochrome c oxidase subunit 4
MSEHIVSIRSYLLVFAALMFLLVATIAADLTNLGVMNTVIAFSIAAVKALLVAAIFMHLKFSSHLMWIFAGAGVFWLGILVTLTMSDYLTRY